MFTQKTDFLPIYYVEHDLHAFNFSSFKKLIKVLSLGYGNFIYFEIRSPYIYSKSRDKLYFRAKICEPYNANTKT